MANNLTEYIQQITSTVDRRETDPRSMGNLAKIFLEKGDYDKAFAMFLGSNNIKKAVELLKENNIQLDDEAVE